MNPSERNKCRYSLVILVIESSSPKNPDELSQRAADSLLDAPVAVFQFGREPNMRETSAREPEHSAEPHGTAHASSLVVNMPRRWSCKGVTFLNYYFFFLLFSILQGLYKSCSPRVKKIQRPSMNRIQNVQIMTLFYFFQMYARCEYDATKKGWERGSKGLQNRCVKI